MEYKGYTEYTFANDTEMANFYENMGENSLGLMVNEYCLLYSHDGVLIDKIKWDGNKNIAITYKTINNDWFTKIKPVNIEQELAFDMLQDKNTTVKLITGKMGSGKTYLTVCHALQALKQNKFDKIVYLRNNVSVKDVPEIGIHEGRETRVVVDTDNMDDGLELNNEVSQELKSIYGVYFVANTDYAITNENEILDCIESRNA